MANFDYVIAYEDHDEIHTSRWNLEGVSTKADGNLGDCRLWVKFAQAGDTLSVAAYKDYGCESQVAAGVANAASLPAKCSLSASNDSGLTGEFYIESIPACPSDSVEVLVSLVDDSDLNIAYAGLSELDSLNATSGMAEFCADATKAVLLRVAGLYAEELGGAGAPTSRYRTGATRLLPDYRKIANPDQLKEVATHRALYIALGREHQLARDTMYSDLRDYHENKFEELMAGLQLALNSDPDDSEDADVSPKISTSTLLRA